MNPRCATLQQQQRLTRSLAGLRHGSGGVGARAARNGNSSGDEQAIQLKSIQSQDSDFISDHRNHSIFKPVPVSVNSSSIQPNIDTSHDTPITTTEPNSGSSADSLSSKSGVYRVENIIAHRSLGKQYEYFIKWWHYPHSENTWEPEANVYAKECIDRYWSQYARDMEQRAQKMFERQEGENRQTEAKVIGSLKGNLKQRSRPSSISSIASATSDSPDSDDVRKNLITNIAPQRKKRQSKKSKYKDQVSDKLLQSVDSSADISRSNSKRYTRKRKGSAATTTTTTAISTSLPTTSNTLKKRRTSISTASTLESTFGPSLNRSRRSSRCIGPRDRNIEHHIEEIETMLLAVSIEQDKSIYQSTGYHSTAEEMEAQESGSEEVNMFSTEHRRRHSSSVMWTDQPSTGNTPTLFQGSGRVQESPPSPSPSRSRTPSPSTSLSQYRVIVRWKDGTRSYEDADDMYRRAGYSMCKFFEAHLNFAT